MNPDDIALLFKALGDPTRLRIFEFLRWQCCAIAIEEDGQVRPVRGSTVGEVCCHILGEERITSTLSHHLKELRLAGLINVERQGKNMICSLNRETLALLQKYLRESEIPLAATCGSAQRLPRNDESHEEKNNE